MKKDLLDNDFDDKTVAYTDKSYQYAVYTILLFMLQLVITYLNRRWNAELLGDLVSGFLVLGISILGIMSLNNAIKAVMNQEGFSLKLVAGSFIGLCVLFILGALVYSLFDDLNRLF